MEHKPRILALIGLDGAGKTTQIRRLQQALTNIAIPAVLCPSEPIGPTKGVLDKMVNALRVGNRSEVFGLETEQLLYTVIKWNSMRKALENAGHNQVLLMDRYSYCLIAAARCRNVPRPFLIDSWFDDFPTPSATILLDTPPEVCAERMLGRGKGESQSLDFLRRHREAYRNLDAYHSFHIVDGTKTEQEQAETIMGIAVPHCRRAADTFIRGMDNTTAKFPAIYQ